MKENTKNKSILQIDDQRGHHVRISLCSISLNAN